MSEEKKLIYLDNAATTKTAPEVVEAMLPYFTEMYGNPSSVYSFSQKSKEAITAGREKIAKTLGANPEEIYFTAGGSESDNWALKATAEAYKEKGNHIITTKIEHHAILHTGDWLEKHGFVYLKTKSVWRCRSHRITLLCLFLLWATEWWHWRMKVRRTFLGVPWLRVYLCLLIICL